MQMRNIRHIKKQKWDRPTKFIRIDPRTTIQVDASIPDDVAKSNYLTKTQITKPVNRNVSLDEFVKGINFFR